MHKYFHSSTHQPCAQFQHVQHTEFNIKSLMVFLLLQTTMSELGDIDFLNKLIQQSEKVMCSEMAKLQKKMNEQEEARKVLEQKVATLSAENLALKKELSEVHLEVNECKRQRLHGDCSSKMQTAFSAALQTFNMPPPATSYMDMFIPPQPIVSTASCSNDDQRDTLSATSLHKRKLSTDENSTSQ